MTELAWPFVALVFVICATYVVRLVLLSRAAEERLSEWLRSLARDLSAHSGQIGDLKVDARDAFRVIEDLKKRVTSLESGRLR